MQTHGREGQAALDADDKSRRERQQAKHARKQLRRFKAVILTAQKDRQADPLEKALTSFKTNCSRLGGTAPLIDQAEALLKEFTEERTLKTSVQKATRQHVPAGHPLVSRAERLLRDLTGEKRRAAAIAALQ